MRILSLLFVVTIISSCQSQEKSKGGLSPNMAPKEFQQAFHENKEAILIDVRTPAELSRGLIEGAINMNINSPDFAERAARLDKNKTYFVYCLSGSRSAGAANYFHKIGISNVVNLSGGIMSWQRSGLPVVGEGDIPDKISTADYQKMVNSNEKVLIDFYAPWCAPCVRMEPMLDEVQKESGDNLKIIRVNIDENKRLAKALGVYEIPIFKYYESGNEKWEHKGELDKQSLVSKL